MATQTGAKVIRIHNVPKKTSSESLAELLMHTYDEDERSKTGIEVSFVPSCSVRDGGQVVLAKVTPALPTSSGNLKKGTIKLKLLQQYSMSIRVSWV